MPFTAITGVAYRKKKKRMRLRRPGRVRVTCQEPLGCIPTTANTVEDLSADRKKKKMTAITGEELPADRKKKKRMPLTAINVAEFEPLTAVTGEELEAHKAEWIEIMKSDPDCELPWKSRYGAGMDDETQWPPIWKERIEECPEYEVLGSYLYDLANCFLYKNSEGYRMIVEQMRESRGYDVTASVHGFYCFCPGMVRQFSHISTVVCKYVTDQINERAQKHGEFYVFDEVKKIAMAEPIQFFYTFTVKEATSHELKTVQAYVHSRIFYEKWLIYLKEWRFKPESLNLNQNDAVDVRNACFYACYDCYDYY